MQTIEIDQHPLLLGMKRVKEDMVIKGGWEEGRRRMDACLIRVRNRRMYVNVMLLTYC